jgi:flagellar motility protein MotE (MotC chaperone)
MNKSLLVIFILFLFTINSQAQDNLLNLQALATKLAKKQSELDKREQELNSKEKTLQILKQNLDEKEVELNKIRKQLDAKLKEIKMVEDKNLDQLAKIYSSTKAKSAAEIIAKMDLYKAVKLFQRMQPRPAGKILSSLAKIDPDFASKISEKLTPDKKILK